MKLVANDNDVTSRLLADITVTMVTLAVQHGQMALLGYMMMSWNHIWVMTDVTIRMVTSAAQC